MYQYGQIADEISNVKYDKSSKLQTFQQASADDDKSFVRVYINCHVMVPDRVKRAQPTAD
jgi:hypothetical protein